LEGLNESGGTTHPHPSFLRIIMDWYESSLKAESPKDKRLQ
jgi:hypothetical protein